MDTIKRIYRSSERRTAPNRSCPQCHSRVRPSFALQDDMAGAFDPTYSAEWKCRQIDCPAESF